jgi:hypothetical protein
VRAIKAGATRRITEAHLARAPIWQTLYHDRIVRDEQAFWRIRRYIDQNPAKWGK